MCGLHDVEPWCIDIHINPLFHAMDPLSHLLDEFAVYSPASNAVDSTVLRLDGILDFPSIYRGPPSPEIDAA